MLILANIAFIFTYDETADTSIKASTNTRIAQIRSHTEARLSIAESIAGEIYRLSRFNAAAVRAESRLSTRTFFSPEVQASFTINHEFCPMLYLGLEDFAFFVLSLNTETALLFALLYAQKFVPE